MVEESGRERYLDLDDGDWEALGYIGIPDERLPNLYLENPIHDLFEYTVPGRPMPIWLNLSPGQYRVIREILYPVFQLATKFLLSPASLDWFYYLIYAPRALTDPLVQHNGSDVYEYRRTDTPRGERHAKARAALQRLARTHTIELSSINDNDEATTVPSRMYYEQGVNIKDDSPTPSGIRAHTYMSPDYLRQFLDMCMEGRKSMTRMRILGTKMAVSWGHETAHSAGMASNRRLLRDAKTELANRKRAAMSGYQRDDKDVINEDLFEDENLAEPGYSWESFVFGGNIELRDFNPSNPLIFTKWPNFSKGEDDLRRGGWKPSLTEYIVPKQWILNVNAQEWWNRVGEGDHTALYIKKIIGIRRFRLSPDIDDAWSPSGSSEGIWQTDEQRSQGMTKSRRVSRIRPGVKIPDPSASGANELAG